MIAKDLIGKFVIIRTYSAGVFAGILESREGKEVEVKDAIRIWRWSGAASLSQLAEDGPRDPDECKFAIPVNTILLTECIEILECSRRGEKYIKQVPSWKC